MVSYIKTQWFRLLIAILCLVMACIYIFKPSPDTTTIEGLNTLITYMLNTGLYFGSFIIWSCLSFIDYNQKRIELLEAKAEKYDALCEEVKALAEANRIDRQFADQLSHKIDDLNAAVFPK